MATLRKITLNWEIRTGAITCDTGYIKRQELCDVDLYVTVDGTPYALDTSWALNLSIKPALLGDNAALVAVTTWTASATTGLYQATAQTIGGTALDTYLAANNADTTDDEGNKLVDLDVYYTVSMAMRAKSDTVTVICKPDVGRADDTVPATIIARNDFLVSNGTGLLVNVAAGYAANGAFVAAQASLAITNATNYIEVTAAGVASVNTTAFTAGSYPLATVVASAGAITANTDLRAWITPKPATSTGLTVGTTAIASGTSGRILYDNAGVLGELPVGTGVATALAVNVGSAGAFITFNGDAGTPSALVGTNISGTASGLTAGNVTTNANLTGHVTSTGNAAVLGSFTFAQLNTAVSDADVARTSGTNTFTGVQSMTSPDITTSITTPSTTFALVNATATTVNFAGAATTIAMGAATGTTTLGNNLALTTAGVASNSAVLASGALYTGGTGTTTFPAILHQPTGATAATAWSSGANSGTAFGCNEATGFLGNFADYRIAGSRHFALGTDGSGNSRLFWGSGGHYIQIVSSSFTCSGGFSVGGGALATTGGNGITSSGTLAVTGATTLTGNLTSNGALISTPQALSGAGAVNVTTLTTAVTTTAPAQALTLANGTNGQIKTIVHQALSGGGTWVLTPTTKTGYTTITSTAAGETCTLQFFTTIGWCILSLRGAIAA